ncbi:hypothetical protein BGX27_000895 [Mortierella sp. AM989]|nr:hypothetical protein BGX27_000895 [Mortierella sp. AM989]
MSHSVPGVGNKEHEDDEEDTYQQLNDPADGVEVEDKDKDGNEDENDREKQNQVFDGYSAEAAPVVPVLLPPSFTSQRKQLPSELPYIPRPLPTTKTITFKDFLHPVFNSFSHNTATATTSKDLKGAIHSTCAAAKNIASEINFDTIQDKDTAGAGATYLSSLSKASASRHNAEITGGLYECGDNKYSQLCKINRVV